MFTAMRSVLEPHVHCDAVGEQRLLYITCVQLYGSSFLLDSIFLQKSAGLHLVIGQRNHLKNQGLRTLDVLKYADPHSKLNSITFESSE